MRRVLIIVTVLLGGVVVAAQTFTPLTGWANLAGKTDNNGSVMAFARAYGGTVGPLTNFANLPVRTDSNGSLAVTLAGGTATPDLLTVTVNGITTTSTDAIGVLDATAATAGVPVQMSPRVKWCGTAYNSVSTLSETDCFVAEALPATAAGATTATWKLGVSLAGGAVTYPFTVSNTGATAVVAGGKYGFAGVGNAVALNGTSTALQASDGANYFYVAVGQVLANSADLVLASGGSAKVVFPTTANDGMLAITNSGKTIGTTVKVDALPTVSSCGAGSPAVVAGSTPFAGSVTIGTTSVATCTITFGGTAFPSAPVCTGSVQTSTAANVRAMGFSATTTALTIVPASAWVDSSVVNWHCISSK